MPSAFSPLPSPADDPVQGWGRSFLKNKFVLVLVSLLTVTYFAITNLPWQLDEYSQERQALTSFDMIKEGRWLYQQAPRERDATKPPLIGWISAGLFTVTRSWDVAWRLPSFLAAVALGLLLFQIARAQFGAAAGLIALSAFSLNMLTPRLAALVRTDMPLALIVFLIGLQIWQKIRKQENWATRDRLVLFALLTAGVFIKGPIIYAFLLPGIALFQWRWRREKAGMAWPGWWPWIASLVIFLFWVIGGLISQEGFFSQVIVHEFLGRFGTTEQRPHPPYYYVGHLLHKFAPWSWALVILVALGLRSNRGALRASVDKFSPEMFWLICWSGGGLLLMSLIPSKRLDRIYPLIPPLCLFLGAWIGRDFPDRLKRERTFRWSAAAICLAILLTTHYSLSKVLAGYRDHRDGLATFGRAVRQEAQRHHWRYEAVTTHDGGMLLYLEKTHFLEPDRAVMEWNSRNLDALVMRTDDAARLMNRLAGATLSDLKSERKGGPGKAYVLITRAEPAVGTNP